MPRPFNTAPPRAGWWTPRAWVAVGPANKSTPAGAPERARPREIEKVPTNPPVRRAAPDTPQTKGSAPGAPQQTTTGPSATPSQAAAPPRPDNLASKEDDGVDLDDLLAEL